MVATSTVQVDNISLSLQVIRNKQQEDAALRKKAASACGVDSSRIFDLQVLKKSLDARDKTQLKFVYSLAVHVRGKRPNRPLFKPEQPLALPAAAKTALRPYVIGAGPAGLFAALLLARAGLCPLVVEQGKDVEQRREDVDRFWQQGELDECSNIQNGLGGAGAFSDGKLTSRSRDALGREVLRLLAEAGADPHILSWHKPHLGSDKLPQLISNLRGQIESLGGEFLFSTRLTDLIRSEGRLQGVQLADAAGSTWQAEADTVLLAVGNAARTTYHMLAELGLPLEPKAFAVGLRIQQPQSLIDKAQYGEFVGHPLLTPAEYALTYTDRIYGRSCYTFCNCPGGHIVNASSEAEQVVTNGVSLSDRSSGWANSAVVAQVVPGRDYGLYELDGMEFQQELENLAFRLGGRDYSLPVMNAETFMGKIDLQGVESNPGLANISSVGWKSADLRGLFSAEISHALTAALAHWSQQIPGFAADALLAGVESRTSAPLRILRGEDRQSPSLMGLYPCGEGAGYAGGIISSAIDGMKSALAVLERQQRG